MRTTLTINDDVLEEVRKRAETDGESIGQTVSALLRKALHADAPPIRYPSGFEPLPPRPGTISRDAQVRPYPARRAPMRPPLPDVNVPGSPVDSMQVRHRRAMEWFMSSGQSCWTTFPTTQNGAVLIISGTRHLQTGLPPAMAIEVVRNLTQVGDPRFLPEGISLPEPAPLSMQRPASKQRRHRFLPSRRGGVGGCQPGNVRPAHLRCCDTRRSGSHLCHPVASRPERSYHQTPPPMRA